MLEPPEPDQPIVIAHCALAAYRRTGQRQHLLSALKLAEQLRAEPAGRLDVHRGPWAGWLLGLECRSPFPGVAPGAPRKQQRRWPQGRTGCLTPTNP